MFIRKTFRKSGFEIDIDDKIFEINFNAPEEENKRKIEEFKKLAKESLQRCLRNREDISIEVLSCFLDRPAEENYFFSIDLTADIINWTLELATAASEWGNWCDEYTIPYGKGYGFIAAVLEQFVKELVTEYIDNIESIDKAFFDERRLWNKVLKYVHYHVDLSKESKEVNETVREIMELIEESGRVLVLVKYWEPPFGIRKEIHAVHPRALADEIEGILIENPRLGEKLRELFKDILAFNSV